MVTCKDLEITRKTTKIYEILFKKDGIAEDITGWTIYFTVKINVEDDDGDAKIAKVITVHSSATEGKTLITLEPTDTDIEAGIYWHSIDYKDDNDNEGVLFTGRLRISEPILQDRV